MERHGTCTGGALLLAQYATELLHAVNIGVYVDARREKKRRNLRKLNRA